LQQCFDRSKFDFEKDQLIQLGDVCDGWSEVKESVDLLLRCKNAIFLVGNHDHWFWTWLNQGIHPVGWMQGGNATAESYIRAANTTELEHPLTLQPKMGGWMTNLCTADIPKAHVEFFKRQNNYYIDEKNRCFVHGGFNKDLPITETDSFEYCWDRDLWKKAMSCAPGQKLQTVDNFSEIFLGHTATVNWSANETKTASGVIVRGNVPIDWPIQRGGVTNMDTGAGFKGKLSFMDVDTHEYWQSDEVTGLYPDERGRR
jgi:serine/threonine protein phosphatase 1